MNYPSVQVTNFLDNPDYILNYAKSLEYKNSKNYPGLRTQPLHEINFEFFTDINSKIIRLLYPDFDVYKKVEWQANSFFQKINYKDIEFHMLNKENPDRGWIHNDDEVKFTAIIYLSKGDGCGTGLYSKSDGFKMVRGGHDVKYEYYLNNKEINLEDYLNKLNKNLNKFKLECLFNSSYNKMIGFDGSNPHGAFYNLKPDEERITYISFFKSIMAPYCHIPEMRRL